MYISRLLMNWLLHPMPRVDPKLQPETLLVDISLDTKDLRKATARSADLRATGTYDTGSA
ncbi:hypothetical protein PC129_g17084 [Phytophthora cactorum]|uniref:Uncharacterized protein n=1 Tax=Phytophthora cactorum TaxID=29920 RepID=A0A329RBY5_9STRA|nr:hypothetical protein Pcac1_g13750 [Phytophthora cactorum]KAG2795173.1 hypothetical protein PC111_g22262 [Phytophthora cactorum]KAG2795679.1 hypothetical protein PC112_g22529 [Phytophthora cactorum]KAG2844241.1 hypothetical protein PC113_g18432 [Phytophthora cactorum]KAG2883078.1 hypothetical protein PC115_g21738 [Phytophthora cactorum]